MNPIEGTLPKSISKFTKGKPAAVSDAYPVNTYEDLYRLLPELSWENRYYKLLYRGQDYDYCNDDGESSIYPTIYRGDKPKEDVASKFDELSRASGLLSSIFESERLPGYSFVTQQKIIRWTLLQHYNVCDTPLLDMTQSLVVACSFAQESSPPTSPYAYVYVFGIPELTEKIVSNYYQQMVIINLQGSCPPDALRPYNQEGYLVGTLDTTTDYRIKSVLDFNRRLIAKFRIPNNKSFWGRAWARIPKRLLYPEEDLVFEIAKEVKKELTRLHKSP